MSDVACWILIGLGVVLMFISDGYGSDALAMLGMALLLVGIWTLVLS
jgi:hypothetical protein